MPEQPFAYVTYPGVERVESCTYTLSHGITPASVNLEITPQEKPIAEQGDLTFLQGSTKIVLRDCKVATSVVSTSKGGFVTALTLYDRRWKWRLGYISGHYNLRDEGNQIVSETEKAPQDLAKLLLEAMGEGGADVSQLPNDSRPTVEWEWANPAQELESLATLLGCRVVLGVDNRVRLCRLGVGATLPVTKTEEEGNDGFDPPEVPSLLICVGGKRRCQADLRLEAVGRDTDFTVKAINDLSFKPTNGWGNRGNYSPDFSGISNTTNRELARRYVYRLYRFTLALWDGTGSNADPKLKIPGASELGIIRDRRQIELEEIQVETFVDAITQAKRAKPATVRGTFWNGGLGHSNETFPTEYKGSFAIVDRQQGLVEFQDYLFKFDSDGTRLPADLILRCAVSVREPTKYSWLRHYREKTPPGAKFNTKPRILFHEEIVLNIYPSYGADTYPTATINTNQEDVNKEMFYYLDAAAKEYEATETQERHYPGLLPISPDGAIQQVGWEVTRRGGSTTHASRNTEHSHTVPSYAERRLITRMTAERIAAAGAMAVAQRAKK